MPETELGVVIEVADGRRSRGTGIHAHRIKPPAAGDRIARLGGGDALEERRRGPVSGKGEPAQDEPVREPVVDDDRVALRIAVAERAVSAPQLIFGERCEERSGFAVDRDRVVDRLDVVVGPDVAVGIRRPACTALTPSARVVVIEAGEVLRRSGHRREKGAQGFRGRRQHRRRDALRRWRPGESRPVDFLAGYGLGGLRRQRPPTQVAVVFARRHLGLSIRHARDHGQLRCGNA